MSIFEALALISFTIVFGIAVLMKISTMSASFSHLIATGVENGFPLSLEYRWMMLWNFYISTMMTGLGFAAGVALVLVQIRTRPPGCAAAKSDQEALKPYGPGPQRAP